MSKSTVTREGIKVASGQRWRDLDKRSNGRTVQITWVSETSGLAYYEKPVKNKLRIDRMRKPFWELVQ